MKMRFYLIMADRENMVESRLRSEHPQAEIVHVYLDDEEGKVGPASGDSQVLSEWPPPGGTVETTALDDSGVVRVRWHLPKALPAAEPDGSGTLTITIRARAEVLP